MEIGVSLACFYPRHPEEMINTARSLGFSVSELFINTYSELQDDYIRAFEKKASAAGLGIHSVHPFTSAIENYMFFSRYDRRIEDAKALYGKYCEAAKILGAGVINMHGDRGLALTDIDEYIECLKPSCPINTEYALRMKMCSITA